MPEVEQKVIAKSKRRRISPQRILLYLVAAFFGLNAFWPMFTMAATGYGIDWTPIFTGGIAIRYIANIPFYSGGIFPTPAAYVDALTFLHFPARMLNSLIIAFISISISLVVGVPVAYILARVEIRGRTFVSYLLLALRTVSPFVVIIPLYISYSTFGLYDNYGGVALAEDMLILTVVVWMIRGFFTDIPRDIYDAATVFGKTEGQIFRRVILPMVIPGIVVASLFALVLVWNEFLIAETLTGATTKTVAVGIWSGVGESVATVTPASFDDLNATGTLAFVPAIAVMILIRKYLAKGFSLGIARS